MKLRPKGDISSGLHVTDIDHVISDTCISFYYIT